MYDIEPVFKKKLCIAIAQLHNLIQYKFYSLLSTESRNVPINFACGREWNEQDGTFQFTVSWIIPQFLPLLRAIRDFELRVRLVRLPLEEMVADGGQSVKAESEVEFLVSCEIVMIKACCIPTVITAP